MNSSALGVPGHWSTLTGPDPSPLTPHLPPFHLRSYSAITPVLSLLVSLSAQAGYVTRPLQRHWSSELPNVKNGDESSASAGLTQGVVKCYATMTTLEEGWILEDPKTGEMQTPLSAGWKSTGPLDHHPPGQHSAGQVRPRKHQVA